MSSHRSRPLRVAHQVRGRETGTHEERLPGRHGTARLLLPVTVALLVAVSLPVVWRGAPLGDDFNNCLAPRQLGLGGFLEASWERLGVIRAARFVEILLSTGVCRSLPFGVAIAIPLALTILVALLLRRLLLELELPPPWADAGAAAWLLQPLGSEAALWPAALHVPLGLALALGSLLLFRRGRVVWGAVAAVAAFLSVEQVIFALPAAAWLTTPADRRSRSAGVAAAIAGVTLVAFLMWPGSDPRLRATLVERLLGAFSDPLFYLQYPAVGLGVHSIPLAIAWAFPLSLAALLVAGAVGAWLGPRLAAAARPSRVWSRVVAVVLLVVLVNAPVVLAVPRQGSPRVFTPTWLVLAAAAAVVGSAVRWRRGALLGAVAGLLAGGALLSLAWSAQVRVASADTVEQVASELGARVEDGDVVALCGVPRTVVEPAPRGAFAVHEFIYDWAAADALAFYTGRHVQFRLAGALWGQPCPAPREVDLVVVFDELRRGP
jgi:hypothetical protein